MHLTPAPSTSPTRWQTGAESTAPTPCSSTPVASGRPPEMSRSPAGSETSTSTARSSIPCHRPGPLGGLAHRLQQQPATSGPQRDKPHRVRPSLAQPTTTTTPRAAGPAIGIHACEGDASTPPASTASAHSHGQDAIPLSKGPPRPACIRAGGWRAHRPCTTADLSDRVLGWLLLIALHGAVLADEPAGSSLGDPDEAVASFDHTTTPVCG